VHIKIENLHGNYFVDYTQGCSEDGKEYIELIPNLRIINKSHMPISIYSIEIILKNKNQVYKMRFSDKKIKELRFLNKDGEEIVFRNLLDFFKPINLDAYQLIEGNLDYWINGDAKELENSKIMIKTSRGNFTRILKFNEIDSGMYRKEDYYGNN
jgi:hypothetical protein